MLWSENGNARGWEVPGIGGREWFCLWLDVRAVPPAAAEVDGGVAPSSHSLKLANLVQCASVQEVGERMLP